MFRGQKGHSAPLFGPEPTFFRQKHFKMMHGSDFWDFWNFGPEKFSDSVSPFLGRHSLKIHSSKKLSPTPSKLLNAADAFSRNFVLIQLLSPMATV